MHVSVAVGQRCIVLLAWYCGCGAALHSTACLVLWLWGSVSFCQLGLRHISCGRQKDREPASTLPRWQSSSTKMEPYRESLPAQPLDCPILWSICGHVVL